MSLFRGSILSRLLAIAPWFLGTAALAQPELEMDLLALETALQEGSIPRAERRFDVVAENQHLETFLLELARKTNMQIRFSRLLDMRFSMEMKNATFEEILTNLCDHLDLASRKAGDRVWTVGYPEDLEPHAPGEAIAPVELSYRCRHLTVDSLADTLGRAFPDLKVFGGPTFKSPTLTPPSNGSSGPGSSGPPGMPTMSGPVIVSGGAPGGAPGGPAAAKEDPATTMRRFDVILVGPAAVARRAMAFARKLDSGRQQVRINVKLMELTDANSRDLGIVWGLPGNPGGTPVVNFTELPKSSLAPYNGNPRLQFGAFAHSPASANLTLQAAEEKSLIKTLASPTLMVLDGERCSIMIGDRLLYPKQTGVNSQGNAIFDIAELKTGVFLQMAPQIGLDHDVTLSVYPQDSSVTGYENFAGNPYPIVTTREAQTTVRLRNGEMLVIGGLKITSDTQTHNRIPGLGSIPILGALFGGRGKHKKTSELVLMIQPEILDSEGPASSSIKVAEGS